MGKGEKKRTKPERETSNIQSSFNIFCDVNMGLPA